MRIDYHVTGSDRKALVRAMVEILAKPPVYLGAPSFAYAVGSFRVDKDGIVSANDDIDNASVTHLVSELRQKGWEPTEQSDPAGTTETSEDVAFMAFMVEVPRAGFTPEAEENLRRIVASKAPLLKKSLGAETLEVIFTEDTVRFPWFTLHGLDGEADAYNRLVVAICKMAKEQKRVVAKECATDNEKFSMRLFLIRLGFIGDEYKTARKILLKNLSGNSSWRSGHRPNRAESDPTDEAEPTPADTTAADEAATEEGGAPYEQ